MAAYFDRDGNKISPDAWKGLRTDDSYRIIRNYDNGKVRVRLVWTGVVLNPSVFRDCYEVFHLFVDNYDETGTPRSDPVENGRTFAYEKDGIKAYEDFLERWTNSHRDDDGFVEEDNILTPPPPPNPDAPTSDVASVSTGEDDVGVW